ncbi:MAG: AI-2E family transporter [Defluviitaleaceae bacterium]|nr:AI-2E family transporter [Defluviitaleaceae bacterium]
MIKFFKSRLMRSLVPYFLLGVLLIIAFRVITGITFFTGHISRFWGVITPFLIGAVLAYILNLPCSAIQRLYLRINSSVIQKRSRPLSVLTLLVTVIVIFVLILNLLIPAVIDSVNLFIENFSEYEETFRGWMETVDSWELPDFLPEINEDAIIGFVSEFVQGFETGNIAASVMAGFGAVFGALFTIVLAVISSIYFLIEKDRLKFFIKRLIAAVSSPKTNETILKYSGKLNHNFHMYIYTQTIDGIILGSLMIGLLLIFQSPFALLLGLVLGIVNYIPYFGSIFGTAFAVLVVAFTQGLGTAAIAGIFMFIVQQLDGNFIQPRLMGGSFSLSPLLVIISVTVGMAYGGVLGMLVAIPIVAICKDILDEYVVFREAKKLEVSSPSDDEPSIMDRGIV